MQNFVITIARGFGSGGKEIATKLAKKLGIPCYDTEFYSMLEEFSGLNRSLFANVDEKLHGSFLLKKLTGFHPAEYSVSPSDKDFISDDNLYAIQSKLIVELANSTSCVIVGKCANYVLREFPNVLSVYIEAPRADCLRSVVSKLGVSEEEAHKLITRTDKYRSCYFTYYSRGQIWTDPVLYDMTLNTGRLKRNACVDLIESTLKIKGLIS